MNIKIVKKNEHKEKNPIYIGRPSIFGNPYKIGLDGNRNDIIQKYEIYILNKLKTDKNTQKAFFNLIKLLEQNKELVLECWCSPLPCHGDILKKIILNYSNKGNNNESR